MLILFAVTNVADPDPNPSDPYVFGPPGFDPLVRGMDPDPASNPDPDPSILSLSKNGKKNLDF